MKFGIQLEDLQHDSPAAAYQNYDIANLQQRRDNRQQQIDAAHSQTEVLPG